MFFRLISLNLMAVSPTLSREKHDHTIQTPSAGEGADRGKFENPCLE
jgi:hypothetical protein